MKSKRFLITVFLPLILTGCTFSASVETLLSPPKLDKQQQDIYNALENYTGENISLKYPKSGDNLSAFIIEDIDGDSEDEAIVFYEKNAVKTEEGLLRINILDTVDSKWRSVYDHAADGNEIEQVEVTRLGDCDRINVIVGYSLINRSEKKISIYDYSDGKLNTNLGNEPYSVFETADLNGDGSDELFIAAAKSASKEAVAVLYHLYDSGEYKRSEVELNAAYTNYCKISCNSELSEETTVFLDAETGNGNVVTEVLRVDNQNNLLEVFSPDTEKLETMRPSAYLSADIDDDGEVEIPVPKFCRGYDENSDNPIYFTSWYNINDRKPEHKYESYYSITDGYIFMIPQQWYGKVTAGADISKNEIYLCSGNDPETADNIFTVRVVSGKEKSTISEENDWILIRTRGDKHFFLKINEENPLVLSAEEIIMRFKFDY
ncbi:MAG: hypothetical protein E7508_05320 [Ruminococcus sp.]|nr:hypothetical protein [Ruminococcus sp.]